MSEHIDIISKEATDRLKEVISLLKEIESISERLEEKGFKLTIALESSLI